MSYLKAAVGGLVGGLVGAGIWAAIAYATGYQIGIIASVVGAIVGFGVRLGAGEEEGEGYGGLAVVLALGAILMGKFFASELVLRREIAKLLPSNTVMTDETMIQDEAMSLVIQYTMEKKPLNWPAGKTLLDVKSTADLPPEIVQEATAKWNARPAEEKEQLKAAATVEYKERSGNAIGELRGEAFAASFSFYDLLWIGLAGLAAFKLGSGMASDDD